ncbi:MAG: hypothetical protein NUV57_04695 [archaeon]|nr:hypothetical protein [archaeon]
MNLQAIFLLAAFSVASVFVFLLYGLDDDAKIILEFLVPFWTGLLLGVAM